jgi:hypothetical protein
MREAGHEVSIDDMTLQITERLSFLTDLIGGED